MTEHEQQLREEIDAVLAQYGDVGELLRCVAERLDADGVVAELLARAARPN